VNNAGQLPTQLPHLLGCQSKHIEALQGSHTTLEKTNQLPMYYIR
jgi:hypothetical protein